ncbi:hypothetical protein Poli38472_012211 [Pythium oligandrum]|uniref:Scaffold protein Nfu/NifU N-terminal domain-containing protein n=1 Tax=Pythium oligandrum TaxID=41045 RepID=A0A8K1FKG6_PYTOL|nr:hypothetical protein Poli38472_012211 [Pythium oligandrum]|eukprot:TMW67095.1 hypothetical protein Poli38472_012211 [Pythium oligandrum]
MQAVRRPVRALVQRSLRQSTRALTTRSPLQPAMQSMIKRTTLFKQSPFALQTGALRSMFIQTESTPNPQSLKFLPGRVLAMRAERRGPPPSLILPLCFLLSLSQIEVWFPAQRNILT